jgi:hypothetical protein
MGSIPDEATDFFELTQSFHLHYGPAVDSASNRNEYQESGIRLQKHKADNLIAICEQTV